VVLKYSCLINGYDVLNITKLDVLDALEEIKVAVAYKLNGAALPGFPGKWYQPYLHIQTSMMYFLTADLDVLSRVEVEYVTLPGWKKSIESTTSFEDLPEEARNYLNFIQDSLKVPIQWVGVGPGRESMITI
jgi:adenylosuccinate synthase